jgi:hypothetical protein
MKPKSLKTWDEVKDKRSDLTVIKNRGGKPEDYLYQCDFGIYYPSCAKWDLEVIPEKTLKEKFR